MEGFERHAKTTGQENPIDSIRRVNDEVKQNIQTAGLNSQLNKANQRNDAAARELDGMRHELNAREQFYKQNAPVDVQAKLPEVFGSAAMNERSGPTGKSNKESRFEEISEDV